MLLALVLSFSMWACQNFLTNANVLLLLGVLFRLPKLPQMPQPVPIPKRARRGELPGCGWEKMGLMCGMVGITAPGSAEVLRSAAERMALRAASS